MNVFLRSTLITLFVSCLNPQLTLAAEVSGPITSSSSSAPFSAPLFDVTDHGYVVEEFFIDGNAYAYEFKGSSTQTADGRWSTRRREKTAPFRSRILVVRPAKAADFNGTIIVHWQNVTAGFELGSVTEGEYLRGYAWVGVSAQKIGIDGSPGPDAAGLKQWDDKRYGSLNHPGDAYSYDIFTQAGRAIGPDRSRTGVDPMGGLDVKRLVAAGASQSAGRLRTYINGVHPIEQVFDGYIPYIDFGSTIPFASDFDQQGRRQRNSTVIRDDLDVPVLVVNSETETLAYVTARQPDTSTFRFWEVAGTSHVSVPRGEKRPGLESANWLSFQPVYSASLRHMHRWLKDGTEPPSMPRIVVGEKDSPGVERDQHGNAQGGIRLPDFVVATSTHSGTGKRTPGGNRFSFLYGNAEDFSEDQLASLYPTQTGFLQAYDEALKNSVAEGMVLAEDAPNLRNAAQDWSAKLK
ncbi:MAG: alpha/beta hydrolase domain-containing protein [Candidatus Hydrogenedentota bacterium]